MEKTVELTLLDRISIGAVLKKEGAFEEIIISRDVSDKVKITQDDVKNYSIHTVDGRTSWVIKEGETDSNAFVFTELEFNMVKDGLKKLQEEKKLTIDHIDLYKKFVQS